MVCVLDVFYLLRFLLSFYQGFAPQIDSILDSMGGSLKSEDEAIAYQQEEEDLHALHKGVVRPHRKYVLVFYMYRYLKGLLLAYLFYPHFIIFM
jgi:hypothetical protein